MLVTDCISIVRTACRSPRRRSSAKAQPPRPAARPIWQLQSCMTIRLQHSARASRSTPQCAPDGLDSSGAAGAAAARPAASVGTGMAAHSAAQQWRAGERRGTEQAPDRCYRAGSGGTIPAPRSPLCHATYPAAGPPAQQMPRSRCNKRAHCAKSPSELPPCFPCFLRVGGCLAHKICAAVALFIIFFRF